VIARLARFLCQPAEQSGYFNPKQTHKVIHHIRETTPVEMPESEMDCWVAPRFSVAEKKLQLNKRLGSRSERRARKILEY